MSEPKKKKASSAVDDLTAMLSSVASSPTRAGQAQAKKAVAESKEKAAPKKKEVSKPKD